MFKSAPLGISRKCRSHWCEFEARSLQSITNILLFFPSVRPSICPLIKTRKRFKDVHRSWYFGVLLMFVNTLKFWLTTDNNNTQWLQDRFSHFSAAIPYREIKETNRETHCGSFVFFEVIKHELWIPSKLLCSAQFPCLFNWAYKCKALPCMPWRCMGVWIYSSNHS